MCMREFRWESLIRSRSYDTRLIRNYVCRVWLLSWQRLVRGLALTRLKWRRRFGLATALFVAGTLGWTGAGWLLRGKAHAKEVRPVVESVARVEIVRPVRGGIQRTTAQPGSVLGFESVDLFAMVSGYLKTQAVDIGSRIKTGDVLAVIDAPRELKALDEATSQLQEKKAQTAQAEAQIKTMEAERDAAAATVQEAESDVGRLVADRELARKQLIRVKALVADRATDARNADEHLRQLETAEAAERTGRLAVASARARLAAANAKIDKARADVVEAKAAVDVAEARLATARVNVDYTRIVAPFNGVVTSRTFHPGAFIRSATDGGQLPLLTVKRTDLMRVVVQVPDRDVVITNVGDPAVVKVDALGNASFPGKVARIGESEDPTTRTMRVEIDLPNPKRLLREGMYGTATITLEPISHSLTLPPACVMEHSGQTHGVVYVVRDGLARRCEVELGADNGKRVEILSGVEPTDAVVLRSGVPLEDGLPVSAAAATTASSG
jgi:HlyD family secretion protein